MRLGNKSTRNEQKGNKFNKTLLFFKKRIKFELIRNITHQMKSWRERERESILYLDRERLRPFIIQDMSYGYKKNSKYRQQRKIRTKNYARKRCPPNQLKIEMIIKYNKNLRLHFFQVTTFVSQMPPFIVIL